MSESKFLLIILLRRILMNNVKTEITPNDNQMKCIKTINGPVMVLAGPGTGKTTIINAIVKLYIEKRW